MKKPLILQCTFLHKILEFLKKIIPIYIAPFHKCIGLIKKSTYVNGETCTTVLSVFWVWFQPKKKLSLCRAFIFRFILVYTQVRAGG